MKNNFFSFALLCGILFLFANSFKLSGQESKSVFEVKQVEAQKTIVIKFEVPTNAVGTSMGKAYEKLYGFLGSNNIAPAGPPFTVYYSFDPNGNTVYEAGVPVGDPVKGNDEIIYKEFPAMNVVSMLYTGPYEALEAAYTELSNYIKTNGLEAAGTSWEVYLTDPSQMTDPKDNQTIIYFPLK